MTPAIVLAAGLLAAGEAEGFDTQIGLDYRVRYQTVTAATRKVEGWANNELAIDARLRGDDFVLGLAGYRNRVPLQIGPLSAQPTPLPAVESSRWDISLGYVLDLAPVTLLPRVSWTFAYTVPGSTIPWTGTPLDFSATRQGAGAGVEIATAFAPFDLVGRIGVVPFLATTLSAAPYTVDPAVAYEIGARLGYTLFPGLRASVDLSRQAASAPGQDEAGTVAGMGLTYFPAQVRL